MDSPTKISLAVGVKRRAAALAVAVAAILGLLSSAGPASAAAADPFSPAPGSPYSTSPYTSVTSVAPGDFNGDGKLDLAAADSNANVAFTLAGDGQGRLGAPGNPALSGGATPSALGAGDFNGDGKLDVVVANTSSNSVSVLLGDGNGGFNLAPGSPVSLGTGLPPLRSLAVGDLTGNGKLDVVIASGDNVDVLLGDGHGGLSPAPGSPFPTGTSSIEAAGVAIGDFTGSGIPDIAVAHYISNNVALLLGDGHGGFSLAPGSPFPTGGTGSTSLALADFNRDGKLDLAVANNGSNNVSVLLGDGHGGLSAAPGSPYPTGGMLKSGSGATSTSDLAAADFNGDGNPDLAVSNLGSNNVSVLLGDGRGGFSPASGSPYAVGLTPQMVAVGDLNGDGKPDLALPIQVSNGFSAVAVLLNQFPALPAIATGTATAVRGDAATLNGTVNPKGTQTSYHFDYGTTTAYSSKAPVPDADAGSGTSAQSVSTPLSGLEQGTTYHFRFLATTSNGTSTGDDHTFTTPKAVTGSASSVGAFSASVAGTVNAGGNPGLSYYFDYGRTTAYRSSTALTAVSGSSDTVVEASLGGLQPETTYYYRVVLSDGTNRTYGAHGTFTTLSAPLPPSVATGTASAIGGDGATLNGAVNPEGTQTSYHFDYGTTTAYGLKAPVPDADVGQGTSAKSVAAPVSGLAPATTYHFRLVATNARGDTTQGADQAFTTLFLATGGIPTGGAGGGSAASRDTTPPETSIIKVRLPTHHGRKNRAKVVFASSKPGSSFECKLGDGPFEPCSSPLRIRMRQIRRHVLQIRAIDAAGNVEPTPARVRL